MITATKKTVEVILTNIKELKKLPDGTVVQEGEYSEQWGFLYDWEEGLSYRKTDDGLHLERDDFYDITWDEVEEAMTKCGTVYRWSEDAVVIEAKRG